MTDALNPATETDIYKFNVATPNSKFYFDVTSGIGNASWRLIDPFDNILFDNGFTNSLTRDESDAVYQRYYIPGSARPFFQAGYANFNPNAVTKVDYRSPERPPLLLLTGEEDRICPPSVNRSNWEKQHQAATATEHKEYPGRCHFPGQDGWEELADYALAWTSEHANGAA